MEERMSPEEQKKMVEKLQKLLALATSPNENEAVLAMEKAADIMEKFSLSMMDVGNGEAKENNYQDKMYREDVPGLGSRRVNWEAILSGAISRAFDCSVVIRPYKTYKAGEVINWSIAFMGFKPDVEMSVWLHQHVRRTVSRISKIKYSDVANRNTFAHGMVSSISRRLGEIYQKRNEVSSCKDLIVVKSGAVEAFKKNQFPILKKSPKVALSGSRSAWDHGFEEGKKVNLNRPLNGSGERSKLGEGQRKLN